VTTLETAFAHDRRERRRPGADLSRKSNTRRGPWNDRPAM